MASGVTSQKRVFWLVFGLIASARSQPITSDALQEGVELEGVPGGVLRNDKELQDLRADKTHALGHIANIANSLEQVFRQGRDLQVQVAEVTGRQSAATLADTLGSLFRPAITAFVGALSMNSATAITNAITALLGGRSLDLIPPETFMTAPTGRDSPVQQPTRETAEEVGKRRPSKRKQRHPASTMYSHA